MYFPVSNHYELNDYDKMLDMDNSLQMLEETTTTSTYKEDKSYLQEDCVICLHKTIQSEYPIELTNALFRKNYSYISADASNIENDYLHLKKMCICNCYLHQSCLDKWLANKLECPICRSHLLYINANEDGESINIADQYLDSSDHLNNANTNVIYIFFYQTGHHRSFYVNLMKCAVFLQKSLYFFMKLTYVCCVVLSSLYIVYASMVTYDVLTKKEFSEKEISEK